MGGMGGGGLAGVLGMFGGGGDGGALGGSDAAGASFLQSQFELVKQVLKASIRKISLTVSWESMGSPKSMLVVAYVTDPAGMNKVLGGLGLGGGPSTSPGGGSGSGSNSGGGPIPPRRTR